MQPYYQDASGIVIYHGDCRQVLPHLGMVDHVITDPPYDARTHAGARSCGRNSNGDVDAALAKPIVIDFAPLDVAEFVPLMLLAAKRWTVAFCTMEMILEYRIAAMDSWVRAGFWRRPDGAPQFTGDRPGTPGDAIAIMHHPRAKTWNGGGKHGYWEVPVVKHWRVHPTQKPEELMVQIVKDFTDPGDLILDPFMGSGTTLVAAKRLGRKAIGIELEEKYCAIAAQRLAQGALDLFASEPPA